MNQSDVRQSEASKTKQQSNLPPISDVETTAESPQSIKQQVWLVLLRELLQIVLPAFVLAVIVYTFLAQATVVYGQSMEPTLSQSQRLVVDKLTYRLHEPNRDDIIVVKLPEMNEMLVKRIIGLPGETIEIRDGLVYIDGRLLDNHRQDNHRLDNHRLDNEPLPPTDLSSEMPSNLLLEDDHLGKDSLDKSPIVITPQSFGGAPTMMEPLLIDPEHFFVMGDNRANSNDSRSFGAISRRHILGRVWFRYWPLTKLSSF